MPNSTCSFASLRASAATGSGVSDDQRSCDAEVVKTWTGASTIASRVSGRKRINASRLTVGEQGICHGWTPESVPIGDDPAAAALRQSSSCRLRPRRTVPIIEGSRSGSCRAVRLRTRPLRVSGRGLRTPEVIAMTLRGPRRPLAAAVRLIGARRGRSPRLRLQSLDTPDALELLAELLRACDLDTAGLASRLRSRADAVRAAAPSARHRARSRWNDAGYPAAPARRFRTRRPCSGSAAVSTRSTRRPVAIVGSRAASPVALETAERLGGDLAARGHRGRQRARAGRDSAAHRGALRRAARRRGARLRRRRHLSARASSLATGAIATAGRLSRSARPARRRCQRTSRCATGSSAACRARSSWSRPREERLADHGGAARSSRGAT